MGILDIIRSQWCGVAVITLSWALNAMMDAIDHGKGAQTLKFRWHALKWLSYALPFGYIILLIGLSFKTTIALILFLWVMWELLYRYLRSIDFHRRDK